MKRTIKSDFEENMKARKPWNKRNLLIGGSFLLFALLLTLPDLLRGGVLLGDDFIFHYNRFYDSMMQWKEGAGSSFLSLYGFQQSGRMINVLYGPLFASIQGLVLLLAGSWFRYYLLSNLLLSVSASCSLFLFLQVAKIPRKIAFPLSVLILTTYSVQYWWVNQGFTSWALAFFPLCLIEPIKAIQTKEIRPVQIALSISWMLQIHMLSALFLILAYSVIYFNLFIRSHQKGRFFKKILRSFVIFLFLTLNIWLPYLQISQSNQLVSPFINRNFVHNTITDANFSLMTYPFFFVFLLIGVWFYALFQWKKGDKVFRLALVLFSLFFLMASNVFPWQFVAGKGIKAIELLQFPFRFFLYAIIFFFLLAGKVFSNLKQYRLVQVFLWGTVVLGISASLWTHWERLDQTYFSDQFLENQANSIISSDKVGLRKALHSNDLGQFLTLVQNASPDYLPQYNSKWTKDGLGNTASYRFYVLENQNGFHKEVKGQELSLTWESAQAEERVLPLVVYHESKIILDQKDTDPSSLKLTQIGNPIISSSPGRHQLILSYRSSYAYDILSWIVFASNGASLLYLWRHRKHEK
ncbi:hypothetical protein STRDD13_00497 [Streptococcus sp. DD13]|nr:hypothetical protein STRDD13_00497 [Streptococcus sp. DD13]